MLAFHNIVMEPPMSEEQKKRHREYMRNRRAKAKAEGIVLPSDSWFKDYPEKHLARTRRWRAENPEKASEIWRSNQATRRSTPWGKINNRMWPLLHRGMRTESPSKSKYSEMLGYTWHDLRRHLEAQFSPEMTWENNGTVWQIDHIIPLSSFRYHSTDDEEFKKCWALSNLRPLLTHLNQKKGVG
jgi:hypothetical protein